MRYSKLFGKTSKTEGTDLVVDSHRLLIQGGFIRESRSGRYYLLPLGLRVHSKIEDVVRKKMDSIGSQEIVTPTLHPKELWEETSRTDTTGFELITVEDRRGAEFVLGGTAEEMMVDLVRKFNISYKDLPVEIYQFSNKFRDELRASGGLLRVREFLMKDAYSYSTEEQFEEIYERYWHAYSDIFNELGLKTDVVRADNGYIGGEYCHEFVAESAVGESRYFIDEKSGYAAHEDVALFEIENKNVDEAEEELREVEAVRGKTMEDGVRLHNLPLWQQTKDVLFFDDTAKKYVLVVIRGDLDVNETKLTHVADVWNLRSATEEEIREDLGSEPGFISPVGITKHGKKSGYPLILVADSSLRTVKNMYGGANKKNTDLLNINIDRDFTADIEADVALAQPGMKSLEGGELVEKRGIEVGNIFQNGYHYSNLMKGSEYTDEQGQKQKLYAGCYGIGVGRTMAAVVEAHKDKKGIVWPESVAPYKYHLVTIANSEDDEAYKKSEEIYLKLKERGDEVLWDDRIETRAGEKFADADLIGCPIRLVVSPKTLEQDSVEVKLRTEEESKLVKISEL